MKKILILISIGLVGTSAFYFGCNKTSGNPARLDSGLVTIAALYDTGAATKPAYVLDFVLRIIKDSVKYIQVDNNTQKLQRSLDTSYFVRVNNKALGKDGKALKNHSGGDSLTNTWVNIFRNRIIKDFGRFDSALKNYKP